MRDTRTRSLLPEHVSDSQRSGECRGPDARKPYHSSVSHGLTEHSLSGVRNWMHGAFVPYTIV